MAKNLCSRCFHSYVCEQFNEHRDSTAEYTRCHFYNDHFVDAADVEVVVHGQWILREDGYHCSNCDIQAIYTGVKLNYCPNCGAKMKED